jgi:hypothetical protein
LVPSATAHNEMFLSHSIYTFADGSLGFTMSESLFHFPVTAT